MDGEPVTTRSLQSENVLRLHRSIDDHRQRGHVTIGGTESNSVMEKATGTCWCISKGMAGMNSQTSGLARAAGFDYEFRDAVMKFPWNCLPLQIVPRSPGILREPGILAGPAPQLVVSCGRHGIIPALTLKKRLGSRVFTVHIQDPRLDTSGFDLVVIPRHDGTRGRNVYLTTGALHYVSAERLSAARTAPEAASLTDRSRPLVAVLLGGPNGYYSFSSGDIERLVDGLKRLVAAHDVRLAVLKSRRTPQAAADILLREFGGQHFVWDGEGTNPYFSVLGLADYVVVTGDSVSMVTEATATGRPVYVFHLTEKRAARRFRRFHQMFEADGFTRPFDGELDDWTYEPPNDTPCVARIIRERMGIQ